MGKCRMSDEQIIAIIPEHESGVKNADYYRSCNIQKFIRTARERLSDTTLYMLKAKFGAVTISGA